MCTPLLNAHTHSLTHSHTHTHTHTHSSMVVPVEEAGEMIEYKILTKEW